MPRAQEFTVRFTFVSTKADGDPYTRDVKVRAHNPAEAENIAWRDRVSHFGARGNDNAIDCKVVTTTSPADFTDAEIERSQSFLAALLGPEECVRLENDINPAV